MDFNNYIVEYKVIKGITEILNEPDFNNTIVEFKG